jgi:exopolysaccharide production protein ExoQ
MTTDINDVVTQNIVNQLLYSVLFIICIITLIPKYKSAIQLIIKGKFLFIFLLYAFLSILWSEYTFISFKRIFQIITVVLIFVNMFAHVEDEKYILRVFRFIVSLYLFSTLLVVFTVSGAKDPQFLTWRGFAQTKNNLGQVSLITFIVSFILSNYSTEKGRYYDYLLMLLSLTLLFGSRSGTSIVTFIGVIFLLSIIKFSDLFKTIGLSRTFTTLTFAFIVTITFVLVFYSSAIEEFTLMIGKDPSFTGRTDLWENIYFEILKHPILGAGYQSFWVVENPDVIQLYGIFVWLPNQAHNGYLDMINDLGIVGFGIFVIMMFNYFYQSMITEKTNYWAFIIIAVLVINLQESTLFRTGNLSGLIFIFSYLFSMKEDKHTSLQ